MSTPTPGDTGTPVAQNAGAETPAPAAPEPTETTPTTDDFTAKLVELGLTADQVEKLRAEGATSLPDVGLLTAADIKAVTGCGIVTAAKVVTAAQLGGQATPPVAVVPVDPSVEIPDGTQPTPAQVNGFATSLGIDPGMLSTLLFTQMSAGAGLETDISSVIPVPQIVAGYNPKIRNLFFMVMGQVERRLGGQPVVAINEDGSVNQELTTRYINEREEGFGPAEGNVYYDEDGQPHELIRVGVDAQSIYDADPLDSSSALQKSGIGIGRVNWSGVDLPLRQVVFYGVQSGEINPHDDATLQWLRDTIRPGATRLALHGRCPQAITAFNEARRTGTLPTLRVQLSRAPRRPEMMPRRRPAPTRNGGGASGAPFPAQPGDSA
jgi:hypothetical protein